MGNSKERIDKRTKNRRFKGNQHTKKVISTNTNDNQCNTTTASTTLAASAPGTPVQTADKVLLETVTLSASAKKLKLDMNIKEIGKEVEQQVECYVLFNTDILTDLVKTIGKCPICISDLKFFRHQEEKKGLCQFFNTKCISCHWEKTFSSSKELKQSTPGRKHYDVNVRSAIAFREIGRGHSAIEKFCGIMNIPSAMNKFSYENTLKTVLHNSYITAGQFSMKKGAEEVIRENIHVPSDNVKPATVSFDGSWQRRGYASLNGVLTAISQGKCIDIEIMTKVCRSCIFWETRKGTPSYDDWKLNHKCFINHTGSAGSMETAGALQIYNRSIEKNNMRYLKYRGDGDSKAYKEVTEADPYQGIVVQKSECVGHVQKRVGARLRTLKDSMKGKKLSDGKGLTGKGRMTNLVMNTLQNYYGLAIRQNKGNVFGMKKSIAALIYHCSENANQDTRHQYCPRTANSWCKYQADKVTGKKTYKQYINIPSAVSNIIKPIFSHKDLGSEVLLARCIDGETQNVNEALNQIIWKKVPKDVFVGRTTLEIGVYSAIISYNDGFQGLKDVMKRCNLVPGHYAEIFFNKSDKVRVKLSTKKSSKPSKLRRQRLHLKRKGHQDKNLEKEGEIYAKGGF